MAKKKATRGKPAKKTTTKARGKVEVKKGPRSQALPGMESKIPLRIRNYCEAIGEIREKKNQLNQNEKVEVAGAMKAMREEKREVVKWAGVELVFVKGDDKLRVRLVHDGGDGESEEDPDPVPSNQADGPQSQREDPEPFNPPADDEHDLTADI